MKYIKKLIILAVAATLILALAASAFAAENSSGFSDVDENASYADAVRWAADHGYFNGYPDGRFGVDDPVTRAQLAAVLHRVAGTPAASGVTRFSDVTAGAYYVDAASWAQDNGLIAGYPDGRFGVNDPVTRQQVATILWRWAGSPAAAAENYADESDISAYAQTAVDWSRANNIVAPHANDRFDPQISATRAEIATTLMNYVQSREEQPASNSGSKSLVAYFAYSENIGDTSGMDVDAIASASLNAHTDNTTGNLQVMAGEIQDKLGADVHQILITEPYDPEYETMRDRANNEIQNDIRLALTAKVENLDQYEVIYLGTPVWFGELPPAVVSFLSENDLSGHTIVPIGIHLGSGFGANLRQIQELCPNATVAEGFTIRANSANSQVKEEFGQWLDAHAEKAS